MDTTAVLAQLPFHLTYRLYVRQTFDVAHRTANLRNHKVILPRLSEQLNLMLYLVRDMRHHLHGLAQIVPAAFFLYDILIDTSRRDVVRTMGTHIQETLVVSEVQIRLVPVFRHVTFAVLVGVQRTGIHIDIRIEFLVRNMKPARFEQIAQRSGNDSFS